MPGWLVLMGALAALGPLAIDMYLPSFPAIVEGLNTTQGQVERTLASYLFGMALAQMIYGPLADRYGRKPPLLGGLIIFTIASVGCTLTGDIEHLTLWRIAQAFGGAAGMVIPKAVIRDNFSTRDAAKAMSLLMLIMGVTPILGPILGGQILLFVGWRGIFGLMAIGGALLLLASLLTMRETLAPQNRAPLRVSSIAGNYWQLLRDRQFICFSLSGACGSAGLFTYISGTPRVVMGVYGVAPTYFGFIFGLGAAALILAAQVNARLLDRHTTEKLLKLALISVVVSSAAALALTLLGLLTLPLLMVCLMGFMASQGFVNPNAAALALSRQGMRLGVASALMGTLQMLFGALAGLAISQWQSDTALPLTGILAISTVLSWLFGRIGLRAA
ncbi:Bcr/CflA family multidrug efflux MFS transporter [Eoetvoesia caeni]|nr:Bcr/CflA family multidrug efflux MFS transporter [Eoetvoesiella caeni]MCI2807181.1 Bcr/CflA family multidrug efflux MFS transporter [Eoetvoesiella caeni]NYT53422.1 Bcr/CflA family multidrug efflux MFS transporter [Eoetvoesiella caeni]